MTRPRSERRGHFDAVIAPHVDRLLAFARRLTGREEDAEDLVQETVIRAWRQLGRLENHAAARAWLFRILHTVNVDDARRRARRRALVDIVELEERHEQLVACADAGPLEVMLASTTTRAVEDALAAIPEEFAQAVELHDLHDLKYREISEVLGIPLGTVMSRISRGRRLVAAALGRDRAFALPREEGSPP